MEFWWILTENQCLYIFPLTLLSLSINHWCTGKIIFETISSSQSEFLIVYLNSRTASVSVPIYSISVQEHELAGVYLRTSHQPVARLTQIDKHTDTDIHRQFRVADLHVFGLWEEETHASTGWSCKLCTERQFLPKSGHSYWEMTQLTLAWFNEFGSVSWEILLKCLHVRLEA